MTDKQLPTEWVLPNWHPDYGNTRSEFEHLRALATAIPLSIPQGSADLILPEPGLMYLHITGPAGCIAEVYSLSEEKGTERRRYALFLSPGTEQEQEEYANDLGEALVILNPHPSSSRESNQRQKGSGTVF